MHGELVKPRLNVVFGSSRKVLTCRLAVHILGSNTDLGQGALALGGSALGTIVLASVVFRRVL